MVTFYTKEDFDDLNALAKCCVQALKNGDVLCVPTDTVYGLVCLPINEEAIQKIAQIKRRPENKPFALFVSTIHRLRSKDVFLTKEANILADCFWPGALTLVVSASEQCPCAHQGTVGIRSPNHAFVQKLLEHCGGLLLNTSINRSGEGAVTSLEAVQPLLNKVDVAVDFGPLPPSLSSTVVDCTSQPIHILREGAISTHDIYQALEKEN